MINNFDYVKCNKCYRCIEICPMEIIEKNTEDDNYPLVNEEKAENCIKCGHCEAICPSNAISVNAPDLVDIQDNAGLDESSKTTCDYFKKRRSVRIFNPEKVDRKILEQIFDTVRYAPTGVNRQEIQWSVVQDSETVKDIAKATIDWMREMIRQESPLAKVYNFTRIIYAWKRGRDPICRNAPHLILTFAHKNDRSAHFDGIIACSHLDLLAPAFGCGACWAGYLNIAAGQSEKIREMLNVPEEHVCNGILLFGRPKYSFQRSPKRKAAAVHWG